MICWCNRGIVYALNPCFWCLAPRRFSFLLLAGKLVVHLLHTSFRIMVVQNLRVPRELYRLATTLDRTHNQGESGCTNIIIFHVSTGRSASLKLQSNFSSAMGSSVGSWYGVRYSWANASVAVIRFLGSNTSILSNRSIAAHSVRLKLCRESHAHFLFSHIPDGSAFLNLFLRGCRSRLGSDLTNRRVCHVFARISIFHNKDGMSSSRHTFSLAIVLITSSGGVPNNSVMMENWFT